jgi:hypothetical protein
MNTEKKLMSLINSMSVLNSTLDLDEVLHQLIKEVLTVIEGSNASVLFLYDKKLNKLYAKAAVGFDMKHLKNILLNPGEGMSGKTFVSRKGRMFLSKVKEFVDDTVGTIISYDAHNDTDLLQTLKVYLETNQNMARSAKKLYVHTNTIKYRLKIIKEILNIDTLDGRKAFDLQLGLYILEYLKIN